MKVPLASLMALVTMFSISIILTGLSEVLFYSANQIPNKGLHILGAVLTLVAGLVLLFNPMSSALVIAFLVAFQLFIRSVQGLMFSFYLKRELVGNWWLLLVISILGVVISVILVSNPMIVGMSLVYMTGLSIVLGGVLAISLALSLRNVKKNMKNY